MDNTREIMNIDWFQIPEFVDTDARREQHVERVENACMTERETRIIRAREGK